MSSLELFGNEPVTDNAPAPFDLALESAELFSGPALLGIQASAGTGKTWTLERLVLSQLLGNAQSAPVDVGRLLVLTFTEAATHELKLRIRKLLAEFVTGGEKAAELRAQLGLSSLGPAAAASINVARNALRDFDRASIYTIHGFCNKVLADAAFELGVAPGRPDPTSANDAVRSCARDLLFAKLYSQHPSYAVGEVTAFLRTFGSGLDNNADPMDQAARVLLDFVKKGYFDEERYHFDVDAFVQVAKKLSDPAFAEKVCDAFSGLAECAGAFVERLGWYPGIKNDEAAYSLFKAKSGMDVKSAEAMCGHAALLATWQAGEEQARGSDSDSDALAWFARLPDKKSFGYLFNNFFGETNKVKRPETLQASLGPGFDEGFRAVLDHVASLEAGLLVGLGPSYSGLKPDPNSWLFPKLAASAMVGALGRELALKLDTARREGDLLDFDGMISLVAAGVATTKPIKRCSSRPERTLVADILATRYQAVLVDEFQDTDALQWKIFREAFLGRSRMVLVGDPKQAIYGFRGADVGIFNAAMDVLGKDRLRMLSVNHRSRREIVEGTNRLFTFLAKAQKGIFPDFSPALYSEKRHNDIASQADTLNLKQTGRGYWNLGLLPDGNVALQRRSWHRFLCAEIPRLLKPDAFSLKDLAVLCRTASEASRIRRALNAAGIPARLAGKGSLGTSPAAEHLALFADAIASPKHPGKLRAFGLTPLGLSSLATVDSRLSELSAIIHRAAEAYEKRGFSAALDTVLSAGEDTLVLEADGLRWLTDYRHIAELFDDIARSQSLGRDRLGPVFASFLDDIRSEESVSLRRDRESEAVSIMTMHASKGLQFPVVFLSGTLEQWKKPDKKPYAVPEPKSGVRLVDPLRLPGFRDAAERDQLRDQLCLWYVAVTRAESMVYMPLKPGLPVDSPDSLMAELCRVLTDGSLPPSNKRQPVLRPSSPVLTWGDSCFDAEGWCFFDIASAREGLHKADQNSGDARVLDLGAASLERSGSNSDQPWTHEPWQALVSRPASSRHPRLSSYSSLMRQVHEAEEGMVMLEAERRQLQKADRMSKEESAGSTKSQNTLPAGPGFGTLVHSTLELLPLPESARFADTLAAEAGKGPINLELLSPEAREYRKDVLDLARFNGFLALDFESWEAPYWAMVSGTLNAQLGIDPDGGPRIRDLDPAVCRTEMGFTWNLENRVLGLSSEAVIPIEPVGRFLKLSADIRVPTGFLEGYLDLCFEYAGKVWVLDWKTNRLDDWSVEGLKLPMEGAHHYALQALIYLATLKRGTTLEVGGARYVFTRGSLDAPDQKAAVVAFDPPSEILDALRRNLEADRA